MADYLAALKRIWKDDPLFCVAVVSGVIAGLAAIVETVTRPWRG